MKDNTFSMAMGKLIAEAEAERAQEAHRERRRQLFQRIRGVVGWLTVTGILFTAFCYRDRLQSLLVPKTGATPAGNESSAAIKSAQDSAAARDKALDQITK